MPIEIRPIRTLDEYRAVERIQRVVWGHGDLDVVPDHLLVTMQRNGGLVLGAFEVLPEEGPEEEPGEREDRLIGFALGFVGLSSGGQVKHCSHMVGVDPAYQNRDVGYRLKLAQREHVLAQGIDLITWTFDPLESRNARLNFHKLGATCNTYLRDLYGHMRDELNVGLPSDRFQVDWHIASAHVAGRLHGDRAGPSTGLRTGPSATLRTGPSTEFTPSNAEGLKMGPSTGLRTGPSLSALQDEGVPLLNRTLPGDLPRPSQTVLPIQGDRLLVQIPAHFQAIKSADLGLACAWREHTQALFEAAFAAGYTVIDLLFEAGQSCYLLKKRFSA
jgi:predicted GNAT superfamily acetyltransferase